MDINKEIADIKKLLNILVEMQKEKGKETHHHYHYHNDNTWQPTWPQYPIWISDNTKQHINEIK